MRAVILSLLFGLAALCAADDGQVSFSDAEEDVSARAVQAPSPQILLNWYGICKMKIDDVPPQRTWHVTKVELWKTQAWNYAANQLTPCTPTLCFGYANAGWGNYTDYSLGVKNQGCEDAVLPLISYFDSLKWDPKLVYGEYRYKFMKQYHAGDAYETHAMFPLIMTPANCDLGDFQRKYGGNGSGPSSGITPGDLDKQPINQDGFWAGILKAAFVPSQETLDLFKEVWQKWATWGPFGIMTALRDKAQAYEGNGPTDDDYTINMGSIWGTPLVFDLNTYKGYIKSFRFLAAGGLWFGVLLVLWRRVIAKA